MSKKSKRAGRMHRAQRGNSEDAGVSILDLEKILVDHGNLVFSYLLLLLSSVGICIYFSVDPSGSPIVTYGSVGVCFIVASACAWLVFDFRHRSQVLSDVVFEKHDTLLYRANANSSTALGIILVLWWRKRSRMKSLLYVCAFAALPFFTAIPLLWQFF